MRKRREEYFRGKVCVTCQGSDNLELDHIDPEHKISHRIWSWTKAKREAELAKCQPMCHTCHKKKSDEAQLKPVCSRGHDKEITGRDTNGSCAECRRENHRRYRRLGLKK